MGKWDKPSPKPIPPAIRAIAVVIKDQFDNPVEGVNTILAPGFDGFTNSDGYLVWKEVPESLNSVTVLYSRDGYANKSTTVTLTPGNQDIHLTLPKLNVFIPQNLNIVDSHYETQDGPIYLKESTAFQLFKDFCFDRPQFDSFIKGSKDILKVNLLNVLGMFNGGLGEFSPRILSDSYYTWVHKFCSETYNLGCLIEFTVFADAQNIFSDKASLINHANMMRDLLSGWPHILIRIANEPYKNLPDFIELEELTAIFKNCEIFGNGETNADNEVYEPTGTEITNHPGRDSEWMRKGKNSLELRWKYKIPVRDNECTRPDQADYNIRGAKEFAALGKMYGIPQCLHSNKLKFGQIPIGDELAFLLAMIYSYDKVPAGFEYGIYFNPHTTQPCPIKDTPECLRIYGSQVGNRAYAIIIQPTKNFKLEPNDGWELVSNEDNLYVELRRP